MVRRKTRVYILSGPSLFGNGIEALLGEEPGLDLVGAETDPGQAIEHIRECLPDVVVFTGGEGETPLEAELLGLVREGFPMSIVEVQLATNTVCVYCGEQRSIQGAGDLVHIVQQTCEGLTRDAGAQLAPAMERPIT